MEENIGGVYLEGMAGKYLVNLNLNKTICTYIINIALEASEKFSAGSDWLKEVLNQAFT